MNVPGEAVGTCAVCKHVKAVQIKDADMPITEFAGTSSLRCTAFPVVADRLTGGAIPQVAATPIHAAAVWNWAPTSR